MWDAYKQEVPDGFVRIEVVLPERQAFIVKKWADEAKRKQGRIAMAMKVLVTANQKVVLARLPPRFIWHLIFQNEASGLL